VAFVSANRLRQLQPEAEGFFPGPPDLAVEVVSPSDSYTDVEGKVIEWLHSGCRLVIVVDPRKANVSVYRSLTEISILTGDQVLSAENLVPGWSIRVAELFEHPTSV
jgi:Uma2 family endonuclease